MSATGDAWANWSANVQLAANGEAAKFDANHPAYAVALAAFYSGWHESRKARRGTDSEPTDS